MTQQSPRAPHDMPGSPQHPPLAPHQDTQLGSEGQPQCPSVPMTCQPLELSPPLSMGGGWLTEACGLPELALRNFMDLRPQGLSLSGTPDVPLKGGRAQSVEDAIGEWEQLLIWGTVGAGHHGGRGPETGPEQRLAFSPTAPTPSPHCSLSRFPWNNEAAFPAVSRPKPLAP